MQATKIKMAALLMVLGLSMPIYASPAVEGAAGSMTLAANEAAPVEVVDAMPDEEADVPDGAIPEGMSLEELQAEIRIACEEFAVDEQVTDDKQAEFVDACVAENMPAEGAAEEDVTIEENDAVPALEEEPQVAVEPAVDANGMPVAVKE